MAKTKYCTRMAQPGERIWNLIVVTTNRSPHVVQVQQGLKPTLTEAVEATKKHFAGSKRPLGKGNYAVFLSGGGLSGGITIELKLYTSRNPPKGCLMSFEVA